MSKKMKLNKSTKVDSVKEMLELSVKEAGDKVAFQYKDEENKDKIVKVTYKELATKSDQVSNFFTQEIGLKPRDRVLVCLKNSLAYPISFFFFM